MPSANYHDTELNDGSSDSDGGERSQRRLPVVILSVLGICLITAGVVTGLMHNASPNTSTDATGQTKTRSLLAGKYAEESHPHCWREITLGESPDQARVRGADGCLIKYKAATGAAATNSTWSLSAKLTADGRTIIVDFAPIGGPDKDVSGTYVESFDGIQWSDGRRWLRYQEDVPAKRPTPHANTSKPAQPLRPVKTSDTSGEGEGHCTANDVEIMNRLGGGHASGSSPAIMAECGRNAFSVFWGFSQSSFTKCVVPKTGMSKPCIRCFGTSGKYAADNCKWDCMSSWCSSACLSCSAGANSALQSCVGGTVTLAKATAC